jgi:hypothetical protein
MYNLGSEHSPQESFGIWSEVLLVNWVKFPGHSGMFFDFSSGSAIFAYTNVLEGMKTCVRSYPDLLLHSFSVTQKGDKRPYMEIPNVEAQNLIHSVTSL